MRDIFLAFAARSGGPPQVREKFRVFLKFLHVPKHPHPITDILFSPKSVLSPKIPEIPQVA